jgi:hypothetical protein
MGNFFTIKLCGTSRVGKPQKPKTIYGGNVGNDSGQRYTVTFQSLAKGLLFGGNGYTVCDGQFW